jgi:6-methylsalicylate decarboxylase
MTMSSPWPARVDLHHHFFPGGELADFTQRGLIANSGWRFPGGAPHWTPETSLAFMDGLGIQAAVLSLPSDLESDLPAPERRAFAREVNTIARQTVDDHRDRFGFFAHLPTPTDVDAALDELTYALDHLGADGITLTNVYGTGEEARSLGDDIFEPLWAELDRRGTLVFLHGEQTPSRNRMPNRFLPTPVSEVPNETYKAAAGSRHQRPETAVSEYADHPFPETALSGFETNLAGC